MIFLAPEVYYASQYPAAHHSSLRRETRSSETRYFNLSLIISPFSFISLRQARQTENVIMTLHRLRMFIRLANDTGEQPANDRRIINDSYCAPPFREIGWQQLRQAPAATHQFLSKGGPPGSWHRISNSFPYGRAVEDDPVARRSSTDPLFRLSECTRIHTSLSFYLDLHHCSSLKWWKLRQRYCSRDKISNGEALGSPWKFLRI